MNAKLYVCQRFKVLEISQRDCMRMPNITHQRFPNPNQPAP